MGRRAYHGIQFIDPLDGVLNVTSIDGFANCHPLLYCIDGGCGLDVGFRCEFLCGRWVPFADQVVHDNGVEIAVPHVSGGHKIDESTRHGHANKYQIDKSLSSPQGDSERFPT